MYKIAKAQQIVQKQSSGAGSGNGGGEGGPVVTQEFSECVKRWIELDDAIKKRNGEIRQIKQEKTKMDTVIKQYMESNNIQQKDINISNGDKIRYRASTRTSPMNREYIYQRNLEYFGGDEKKAKECTDYIFNNRETTTTHVLARYKGRK